MSLLICKAENYHDMVADLVQQYKCIKCNMSLKVHFLDLHLAFSPENLEAVSNEHGNFHCEKAVPRQAESQYAG